MALSILTRRRILAAKTEGSYSVAEALTAAEAAMNIYDSEMKPQGAIIEREGQGALSRLQGAVGPVWNKTTFKSELYGGGSTPVPYYATHLLTACGLALSTATLTPLTASGASATLGSYRGGTLATSAGAMGNFTLSGEAGKIPQFSWEFSGTYIVPSDVALVAPTYPTVNPPVFMGATLTIGGTAYNILDWELSPNNTVEMRPAGNAGTFGYLGAIITNRKPTFKATVEATTMATKNWFSTYTGGATAALNLVIGSNANNIITITAPAMQLSKPPEPTDRNGYLVYPLMFDLVRSAAAGDDEFSIVHS
jgi:hypothetical protein